MAHDQPGFPEEKRPDNDNRKLRTRETTTKMDSSTPKKETIRQRWDATQFSKTGIFWICLVVIVGTMLVGFTWGGWVTGGSSQKAAATMANNAVIQRLTSICVAQFQQDPTKEQKLVELKAASRFQQSTYVREQGWATMPGDEQSDTKVASECAKVLAQLD